MPGTTIEPLQVSCRGEDEWCPRVCPGERQQNEVVGQSQHPVITPRGSFLVRGPFISQMRILSSDHFAKKERRGGRGTIRSTVVPLGVRPTSRGHQTLPRAWVSGTCRGRPILAKKIPLPCLTHSLRKPKRRSKTATKPASLVSRRLRLPQRLQWEDDMPALCAMTCRLMWISYSQTQLVAINNDIPKTRRFWLLSHGLRPSLELFAALLMRDGIKLDTAACKIVVPELCLFGTGPPALAIAFWSHAW